MSKVILKMILIKTKLKTVPENCKECRFGETVGELKPNDFTKAFHKDRRCMITGYIAPYIETRYANIYKVGKLRTCPYIEIPDEVVKEYEAEQEQ